MAILSLQARAFLWLGAFVCWAQGTCYLLSKYGRQWAYGHSRFSHTDMMLIVGKTQCVAWTYLDEVLSKTIFPEWGKESTELWIAGALVKFVLIWTFLWGLAQTVPDPPPKKRIQNPAAREELRKIEDRAAAQEALRQLKATATKAEELKALEEELKRISEKAEKLD